MRPKYRIGLIVAICLIVMLVTSGLLNLLNPDVANFSSGPYSPLFAAISGASSSAADSFFMGSAADGEGENSSLSSTLFDDPTSAAAAIQPSATPFVAAEAAPLANSLLVEPTILQAVSKPGAPATATTKPGGTSGPGGENVAPTSGGTSGAPVAPSEVAVAPDERGSSSGGSKPGSGGGGSSGGSGPTATKTSTPVIPRTPGATPLPSRTATAQPTKTSGPIVITEPANTPVPS